MGIDRLSVTVPSEIGDQLRHVAQRRGQAVSAFVAEAIEHQLRLDALNEALREADLTFGPVPEKEIQSAIEVFATASKKATRNTDRTASKTSGRPRRRSVA